jgi:hypothetical protein
MGTHGVCLFSDDFKWRIYHSNYLRRRRTGIQQQTPCAFNFTLLWRYRLLRNQTATINFDNASARCIIEDPEKHRRSKHIAVHYFSFAINNIHFSNFIPSNYKLYICFLVSNSYVRLVFCYCTEKNNEQIKIRRKSIYLCCPGTTIVPTQLTSLN